MKSTDQRRSGFRHGQDASCKQLKRRGASGDGPDEYLIACWGEVISVLTKEIEQLTARLGKGGEPMKTGRPVPTLSTVERLLDEVDEFYLRFKRLRIQQKTAALGGEDYLDQLSDIYTELRTLELKAKHAAQGVGDFQESLPDDDPEPETPVHGRRASRRMVGKRG